jgi:hypothetical protein
LLALLGVVLYDATTLEGAMKTKLSILKDHAAAGNWAKALSIAAKFYDLGEQRNAILDAHTAITNPRWTSQMGRNIDSDINNGISALKIRYSL